MQFGRANGGAAMARWRYDRTTGSLNVEIMAEKASHSGGAKQGVMGPPVAKGVRNLIQTG
jgi:hypothetical protein